MEVACDHKLKVFIGGLPKEATEETLVAYFKQFGDIKDCIIIKEKNTGIARGFGFLTFADSDMVKNVLSAGDEHAHHILGKKVDVKEAWPKEDQTGGYTKDENNQCKSTKIFVGGLPSDITDEEFKSFFETFGKVKDYVVIHDRLTERSRGFGFVTFDSKDVAETVLKQNSYSLKNKMVEVKRAWPKNIKDDNTRVYNAYPHIHNAVSSSFVSYPPSPYYYSGYPVIQQYYCWNPTFYTRSNFAWEPPRRSSSNKVKISSPHTLQMSRDVGSGANSVKEIDDCTSDGELQVKKMIETDDSLCSETSTKESPLAEIVSSSEPSK